MLEYTLPFYPVQWGMSIAYYNQKESNLTHGTYILTVRSLQADIQRSRTIFIHIP